MDEAKPETLEITQLSERQYVGAFTAREVMREPFEEKPGLELLDAPVHVLRSDKNDGSVEFEAVIEHEPLCGEHFLNFLKTISPHGEFDDIRGVLADWDLPDRNSNDYSDRLNNLHANAFKKHWSDFEAGRKLFIDALRMGQKPRPGDLQTTEHFLSLSDIRREFGSFSRDINAKAAKFIFGLETLPDFRAKVIGYIREAGLRKGKRMRRLHIGQSLEFFSDISKSTRNEFVNRYFAELDEQQQEVVFQRYKDYLYMPVPDGGEQIRFAPRSLCSPQELERAFASRKAEYLSGTNKTVEKVKILTTTGVGQIVYPETLTQTGSVKIQPVVRWRTQQTGKGTERTPLIHDEAQYDSQWPPIGARVVDSNLAGLLLVSYFTPDERGKWPKRVGLPGSDVQQRMGAAQVPILVLMKRNALTEFDFIKKAESL